MTPNDWANAARHAKFQQNPEDQKAIDILESMLLGKGTPSDAADAIAATYEAHIKQAQYYGSLGVFWSVLSDAARKLGGTEHHTDKLTDLIIAIQRLPDVTDTFGAPVKHINGGVFWRDLPDWAITFREYGIFVDGAGDFEEDKWSWREQVEPLLNATTFAATLLSRASFPTSMEFHACTALSSALYSSPDDLEEHQEAELYMPAAATWILRAGQRLQEACRTRFDAKHTHTFSPERWNEWKGRFEAISIDSKFEQENRDWAAQAARRMEMMQ